MTLHDEMLAQLSRRVLTIESDVRRQTCEVREIKATLAQVPTRRWLATWCALGLCAWAVATSCLVAGLLEHRRTRWVPASFYPTVPVPAPAVAPVHNADT